MEGEGEAGKLAKVQVQGTQEPPNPMAHPHLTGEETEAQAVGGLSAQQRPGKAPALS